MGTAGCAYSRGKRPCADLKHSYAIEIDLHARGTARSVIRRADVNPLAGGQRLSRLHTEHVVRRLMDQIELQAILVEPPPSPLELNADLPEDLERILLKALDKDRRVRYQTAADLRADLTRLKRATETRPIAARTGGATAPRRVPPLRLIHPWDAVARDGRTRWSKGGKPTVYSGKQFWWSKHEPDFEELIDSRGKEDVDSPLGEWTRVECLCSGNRITVVVNGVTVNECYNVYPSAGKILLESEGFEIHFRKFELKPLPVKKAT